MEGQRHSGDDQKSSKAEMNSNKRWPLKQNTKEIQLKINTETKINKNRI